MLMLTARGSPSGATIASLMTRGPTGAKQRASFAILGTTSLGATTDGATDATNGSISGTVTGA